MSRVRDAVRDVVVMTSRNLIHIRREPLRLSDATVQPILFTLLFIYVLGAGMILPGHGSYTEFAIAGLLAMNLVTSAIGTAVGLSDDLGSGVIDRFRTLPMWKPAILVGRSLTDLLTATLCALIVIATGLAVGWRPHDGVAGAAGALALFLLFSYALAWACACIGLYSRDAESSQGIGLIILFPLAIVSDALVPTQHMPAVVRAIAEWNPVSAVTTAARQLFGNPNPAATVHAWPLQHAALATIIWSAVLLLAFAPVATWLYRTRTAD
jgi:ABC-2 type transport system permease protein